MGSQRVLSLNFHLLPYGKPLPLPLRKIHLSLQTLLPSPAMAAVTSLSFPAIGQSPERKGFNVASSPSACRFSSTSDVFRFRTSSAFDSLNFRTSGSTSRASVRCMSAVSEVPTVADTKRNFLMAYRRPIPSVYGSVLQELIVQQHLMRYKKSYQYDPIFSLGFVTVYDRLMEGYPTEEDKEAIFRAYIKALNEDPDQYRVDAQKLEVWASNQNANSLVEFSSREGEVENILKDISKRAATKDSFSYSRFFAIGLFRLLELANATEPTILEKGS